MASLSITSLFPSDKFSPSSLEFQHGEKMKNVALTSTGVGIHSVTLVSSEKPPRSFMKPQQSKEAAIAEYVVPQPLSSAVYVKEEPPCLKFEIQSAPAPITIIPFPIPDGYVSFSPLIITFSKGSNVQMKGIKLTYGMSAWSTLLSVSEINNE